jgi:hypothetical protein
VFWSLKSLRLFFILSLHSETLPPLFFYTNSCFPDVLHPESTYSEKKEKHLKSIEMLSDIFCFYF